MTHYSCSFRGQCEPNPYGRYPSLEECQAQCTSREATDLNLLIYQYSPETAVTDLAPSDQRQVLKRLTGIDSNDTDTVSTLLLALGEGGRNMFGYHELYPYFQEKGLLTDEALAYSGSLDAVDELLKRYPDAIPNPIISMLFFRVAVEGGVEAINYLYEKLSMQNRYDVSFFLTDVFHQIPVDSPVTVDLDEWILTRMAVLRQVLPNRNRAVDLDFLVKAYHLGVEEISDMVVEIVGAEGDETLYQDFIEETGVIPPFNLVWSRNDVVFLEQALGHYTRDEVWEVVDLFVVGGGLVTEEEREVMRKRGIM